MSTRGVAKDTLPSSGGGGGGVPQWIIDAVNASIRTNVADQYDAVAQKTALVEADRFFIEDSEDLFNKKWTSLFDIYNLPTTTASGIGVIYKNSSRFIHDFEPGGATGQNLFVGMGAGNFTMSPVLPSDCSFLIGVGENALQSVTTAFSCTAIGHSTLLFNQTASGMLAIGFGAFQNITSGNNSLAIGDNAGTQTPGCLNVTFATRCLYIGNNTRPGAQFAVDEIILGSGVSGNGNSTTTIGSTLQNDAYLFGNLRLEAAHDIYVGAAQGQTGTFTFGGGGSGDIASMTFNGGVLTAVTTVP